MSSRERAEGLSDSALQREIEEALAVQPSPEFVARVRAAVAADSMRAWPRHWIWLGLATSAIGLVIGAALVRPDPIQLTVLRELPRTHVAVPVQLPSFAELPKTDLRRASTKAAATRVAKVRSASASEPEVLISKDEAEALKRLMRGLPRGEVDPSTFNQSRMLAAGPPPAIVVAPIASIEPIAIEPLGLEGGTRQ
jgi:hypothetical protein